MTAERSSSPDAYSVSKSAIYNLTRYLATYWAKAGVRVNTLTLGRIFDEQRAEFLDAYGVRAPAGRMADAGEALGPVVFPRFGRLVVRHGREPRRRRGLVGLVKRSSA
ncbi:MAG: SDR family oxidoreductase [Gaiellaceae bacterium]